MALCVVIIFINLICFKGKTQAGLLDFNDMIRLFLKINPGNLIGYGHYCGTGHIRNEPVDKIDKYDLCLICKMIFFI